METLNALKLYIPLVKSYLVQTTNKHIVLQTLVFTTLTHFEMILKKCSFYELSILVKIVKYSCMIV